MHNIYTYYRTHAKRRVIFQLPGEMLGNLDNICYSYGITRAEALRIAIDNFIVTEKPVADRYSKKYNV